MMQEHECAVPGLALIDDDTFECDPDDAMNYLDSEFEMHPDPDVSEMNRAGIDDLTPVDTFIESNGRNVFITDV